MQDEPTGVEAHHPTSFSRHDQQAPVWQPAETCRLAGYLQLEPDIHTSIGAVCV